MNAINLPAFLERRIDAEAQALLTPAGGSVVDFRHPAGAHALVAPDSVSWKIFKNPVTLFIGGVAAVILELAEPRVRAGIWDHTNFRADPVRRLSRTGYAAMVTVYAPRERAEKLIAGVNRAHERVAGTAETGEDYSALDTVLLDWVQATATFGFMEAWHRFAGPLTAGERSDLFAEAVPAAELYGATSAPRSEAEWAMMCRWMDPKLEASPVIGEFLSIMRGAPAFPQPLRPLQRLLVAAAVDILPDGLRDRFGLKDSGLNRFEESVVATAARACERIPIRSAPPAQSCLRMGLPADWLYRGG